MTQASQSASFAEPWTPEQVRGDGSDRHLTLDYLRGIAVMGILAANLPAFALPESAYFSPAAWGGTAPTDIVAWFAIYVLIEGKMRGLFALLFGASMLLVVERAEAAGRSGAAVHYRRMGVLLAIGCLHLYGLWWGDILAHYALCGAIAYLFVRFPVRHLIAIALLLIGWQVVEDAGLYAAVLAAQSHPSTEGADFLAAMRTTFGKPPAEQLAAEVAAHHGRYADIFAFRWEYATTPWQLLTFLGPETLATMLLGMAGLKSGFLTGAWPRARYRRWAAVGLGVSLPLYALAGIYTIRSGFALPEVVLGAMTLPALLRWPAILGYAAFGILLIRPDGRFTAHVAAAGRAALSNYLATTLVMVTLVYGFGLFARLSRTELYLLAPPAWVAMLLWSKPWLDHYRHGPVEWLWRSLARGRAQPMRLRAKPSPC